VLAALRYTGDDFVPLRNLALSLIGLSSWAFRDLGLYASGAQHRLNEQLADRIVPAGIPAGAWIRPTSIGGLMASAASPGKAWDRTAGPRRRHKARLRDVSLSPGGHTKANEALALEVTEQLLLAIALTQWDQAEALAVQATAVLRQLVTDQESWAAAVPGLTGAELRLLPLLATHLSCPEIGAELFLSANTIKSQAVSIYRKLGVSSRSEAILRVRKLGLLD
jgi:DNA-binding CsgD family transcriptional regulator